MASLIASAASATGPVAVSNPDQRGAGQQDRGGDEFAHVLAASPSHDTGNRGGIKTGGALKTEPAVEDGTDAPDGADAPDGVAAKGAKDAKGAKGAKGAKDAAAWQALSGLLGATIASAPTSVRLTAPTPVADSGVVDSAVADGQFSSRVDTAWIAIGAAVVPVDSTSPVPAAPVTASVASGSGIAGDQSFGAASAAPARPVGTDQPTGIDKPAGTDNPTGSLALTARTDQPARSTPDPSVSADLAGLPSVGVFIATAGDSPAAPAGGQHRPAPLARLLVA